MTRSPRKPGVVFDCNVLVQGLANESGPAAEALRLLDRNLIDVFVSRAVLKELRAVLRYPRVRQSLSDLDDRQIEAFVTRLAFRATIVRRVRNVFDYPRARQDEPYVDLAAAASADYLVSRDKDLLSLATDHTSVAKQFRQRFPKLRVLDPVQFLAAVRTNA